MSTKYETLTEIMADRKRVADFHAALETSLNVQKEKLFLFTHFLNILLTS